MPDMELPVSLVMQIAVQIPPATTLPTTGWTLLTNVSKTVQGKTAPVRLDAVTRTVAVHAEMLVHAHGHITRQVHMAIET